jgi:hypothetical protein
MFVARSLIKAAQMVRDQKLELASARAHVDQVIEALWAIQRVLKCTA